MGFTPFGLWLAHDKKIAATCRRQIVVGEGMLTG